MVQNISLRAKVSTSHEEPSSIGFHVAKMQRFLPVFEKCSQTEHDAQKIFVIRVFCSQLKAKGSPAVDAGHGYP